MSKLSQLLRWQSHTNQPTSTASKRVCDVIAKALMLIILLLCTVWAGLVLWVHLGFSSILRWLAVIVLAGVFVLLITTFYKRSDSFFRWLIGSAMAWFALLAWFVWLPAKQDRPWQPEVSKNVTYVRDSNNPDIITLKNIRDFDWVRSEHSQPLVQPTQPYYYKVSAKPTVEGERIDVVNEERWVERTIDMNKLSGVDIINSYWMGEPIGHTLLSFRFDDDRPLSFSIEIRKEEGESFSTFGGFVKQFEMILVAAEERDIVFTRSNVRGEQVYMFPLEDITREQTRQLFEAYLQQADELEQEATWYNTLVRNCTTVLFDMAREATNGRFPRDFRILASGYVPNYLYDEGLLADEQWDIKDWYRRAHINPKVADFDSDDNRDSYRYSELVRQGLPLPELEEE